MRRGCTTGPVCMGSIPTSIVCAGTNRCWNAAFPHRPTRAGHGAVTRPFNPHQVQKLLDILRVVQNYVLKGSKDNKPPAMRLRLAKGPVKYEDILYFTGP